MPTPLRITLRVLAALMAIVVIYFAWIAYLVWHGSHQDQRRKVDAIVVLGAAQYNGKPSPVLQARLDHAAALWKQDYAPIIAVTGGRAPGDAHTEAQASAEYLGTKGVPDEDVLREVDGRSTWESLQATALFLQKRNVHSVLLVSDSFHDARIAAMAKSLGLKPYVSPTPTSPIKGSEKTPYLIKEVASLAVGKIIGFRHVAGVTAKG